MGLYVSRGFGGGTVITPWLPGDPGEPNRADTKHELVSCCPRLTPSPCHNAGCDNMRRVHAGRSREGMRLWRWMPGNDCERCQNLRAHHGLELAELVAIWETQGRRCYCCSKELCDPSVATTWRRQAVIDHDHRICPQKNHSCERCRRGLACHGCNTHELGASTRRLMVIPDSSDGLVRWLEFIGPGERDRLRQALTLFPEQPVRRVSRRQSRGERGPGEVIPLFDLGADNA